jgi:type I restriction enzyme, S subunit
MLPTKWPKAPIESLCIRVTSGGTPSRSNPDYYNGGSIPWIKTGELRGWYVDTISERITPTAVKESSAKVFPAETVLLAMYGDGRTMGSVGLTRTPAATNQACCAMLTDPEHCAPKFLMYALMHYKPALLKLAISGAQRNLSGKSIKEFEIGAPPIEVQRRVASAYDSLIENNTRRIAILEEMASRLYEEWFVRFRFPGHESVRMVESDLGLVPQGWQRRSLDTFGEVITGKTPSKANPDFYGDDVPFVKTPDMHGNAFVLVSGESLSLAGAKSQSKKTLPSGSLCVSCIGTIGVVSITTEPCQTNQQINSIVLSDVVVREFLFLRLKDAKKTLENLGANGATMGNVNKSNFAAMEITAPPLNLLARFHEVVEPMFDLMRALARKNQNLRTTRDLLLPKLISGELDVSTLLEPLAETA